MSKKIRVGVVGMGGIGNFHSMAISGNPDCELAAIYDANPAAVERASKSYPQAKACKSLQEFLETPGLKAVVVGTPNNMHAPISIAAAKKKLHVLCEKPLAMDAAEAKKMVQAVKNARVVGMANFGYRRVPSFRHIRNLVRSGKFGKILRVRAEFIQGFLRNPNEPIAWRNLKQFAGLGALGDLGSHMIDAVRYVLGAQPKRAIGIHKVNVATKINPKTGKPMRVTADTDAQFMVDFGSFVGSFETSQVDVANSPGLALYVSAEKGSFRVSAGDRNFCEIALDETGNSSQTLAFERVEVPKELQENVPFNGDFFLAIQKKTKDYPTFDDACVVQKALDAIDRSMKSGKWEKI